MGTVIAASVLVPLSMAAVAYAVDKIEQRTGRQKIDDTISSTSDKKKNPDDLIDLSGGMFGI